MICDHARHLRRLGDYRCSALGLECGIGHPVEFDADLFECVHPFPQPDLHPKTLAGRRRLTLDLTRTLIPQKWRWPGGEAFAAPKHMPAKERVLHRLRTEAYARGLPGLVRGYDLCQWHSLDPERLLAAVTFYPTTARLS